MRTEEAQQKAAQLREAFRLGSIDENQFRAAIAGIRVQDQDGRWWQPDPAGPGWLAWDGKTWQAGTLPGTAPRPGVPGSSPGPGTQRGSSPNLMTMEEFRKVSKETPLARRPQRWWDLLSILGGVVAAAIWFLYGGIRSSREGFDLLTPLLMIAIPVVLVWFRADFDEILMPLQPHRKNVSKILLIGMGLAAPFLTAWILYNLVHISQYPLMQANIIVGTMVSYALVREPILAKNYARGGIPPAVTGAGLVFLVLLVSLLACPVMADDCADDPLNAQDCLRTGGYAEAMAGAAGAGLGALVNGPIVVQGLAGAGASGGAGTGAGAGAGESGTEGGDAGAGTDTGMPPGGADGGGPGDNPNTSYESGNGPGGCS